MAQVLRRLPAVHHPDILVDAATRDDAAVVRIAPDRALIATVDFFTPIVDEAAAWGAIAAANALSDVYAMGGRPLFALNLVGWPRDRLPFDLLGEVLEGGGRVLEQAGCLQLGGHSIDDPEPKVGYAVIGEAHPDRLLTNAGARPGDRLVLTKPLGTGILTTALKRDLIGEEEIAGAVASMTALNDVAARLAVAHGARAATDVTGFGLVGHLRNLLESSGVGAAIAFRALPLLPGTVEWAARGAVPGGTRRNYEAAGAEWNPALSEAERLVAVDAQTSGGLLVALPEEAAADLVEALHAEGVTAAAVIGRVLEQRVLRVLNEPDW